jgi:hypothetical protein
MIISNIKIQKMKKLTIYLVLLLMVAGGCKKYDEGPLISLRSKEARLCREWKLDKALMNDEDIGGTEDAGIIEYKKDGSVKITFNNTELGELIYTSEWRFAEDKKYLEVSEMDYDGKSTYKNLPFFFKSTHSNDWTRYEIIRLTAKEHILKYVDESGTYEFRFEYKAL